MKTQKIGQTQNYSFKARLKYGKVLNKLKTEGKLPKQLDDQFTKLQADFLEIEPSSQKMYLDVIDNKQHELPGRTVSYYQYVIKPFDDNENFAHYLIGSRCGSAEEFVKEEFQSNSILHHGEILAKEMKEYNR